MSHVLATSAVHLRPAPPIGPPFRIEGQRADGPLAVDVVSELSAFHALRDDWNALFDRAGKGPQVFQTFNWNWHWANHYLTPGAPLSAAIITVRREGRLIALWPLVMQRVAGFKTLHWMGEPASQYGDILIESVPDKADIIEQSWRSGMEKFGADAVHLRKVRADAEVAPLLRAGSAIVTATDKAPFLDLASAPDYAAYEQRYSAKMRKNRRRLMRRLCDLGPFAIERHTSGPAARASALEAIAIKKRWLTTAGRLSPALADPRFAAFFADVADGGDHPAGCQVTRMVSNGETVGIAIDVTARDHRAAHIITHDPRFDACSAGMLLIQEWVRSSSAQGIATFDLLAPAYAYKFDWADDHVVVSDYALGRTLPGRIYTRAYLGYLRERLKTAAEAMAGVPAALRARLARSAPAKPASTAEAAD